MLAVGQQVGDYIVEAELGGGGMAVVYRARHVVLGTKHAIKALRSDYRSNAHARSRFVDEARIQANQLDHPNIVKVTGIIATPEVAALVMELVDDGGGSLADWIAARTSPPTRAEFLAIAIPIVEAIAHAHRKGVIHRDLKPANVLLSKGPAGELIPKVTDFGIAKVVSDIADKREPMRVRDKPSTNADARMGTLGYMSPEQVKKAKDVTPRSDVFSLAAVLYELATLQRAFDGETEFDVLESIVYARYLPVAKRVHDIGKPIASAIEKCLQADPMARLGSCDELAAALRGDTRLLGPGGTSGAAVQTSRSRMLLLGLVLVVAVAGAAAFALTRPTNHGVTAPADARAIDAARPPIDAAIDAAIDAPASLWVEHPRLKFPKRVYYSRDKADLSPAAIAVLDDLLAMLRADVAIGVRITGHVALVDEGQSPDSKLGDVRVLAVFDYLLANGIAADRIEKAGWAAHGRNEPLTAASRSAAFTMIERARYPAAR